MNLTIFANEIIFPCLLFVFFSYVMILSPQINTVETKAIELQREAIKTNNWQDFYGLILQSQELQTELDTISDREELTNRLLQIAVDYHYQLDIADIEQEFAHNTDSSQANYVCLPIGCWRVG